MGTPPQQDPSLPRSSQRSDLFSYDSTVLQGSILSHSASKLDYHEYAVFKVPGETLEEPRRYSVVSGEALGPSHFDQAFHSGHGINANGEFEQLDFESKQCLEGRVRQVICRRNVQSEDGRRDGLLLSPADFAALDLHPGTLQCIRRTTTESMVWNRAHDKLSLILAFSSKPRPPFDFLSMTYSIPDRTATILIRQSFNASKHHFNDLTEYDARMESCRAHWAHPLVTAVVLLQVQFGRTEAAVADNQSEVHRLEQDVSGMAGFAAYDLRLQMRTSSMSQSSVGGAAPNSSSSGRGLFVGKSTTQLMKHAHDALRRSIRLLDTVRWMERAVRILMRAGDELEDLLSTDEGTLATNTAYSPLTAGSYFSTRARQSSEGFARRQVASGPLANHWHEIRQYLEGLLQLCMSLDTDRSMLEVRCKAQIDMIYSMMAQEDNNLNARMAVASTRDSSSMKALAVITAIFLPGEFVGTLFGMSMFDWVDIDQNSSNTPPIVTSRFWIYWAIVVPLSGIILFGWRAWWIIQDRQFRRHLSPELSEQKYWTDTGRPRDLESSFWYDFFYLSVRRESRSSVGWERKNSLSVSASLSRDSTMDGRYGTGASPLVGEISNFGTTVTPTMSRMRQVAFSEAMETRGHAQVRV